MCTYRLGTTSFIQPADLLPNVRYLAPRLDDVELVLFESDEITNLPGPAVVDELARVAATYGLSYTVHLPLDVFLGAFDEQVRRASIDKALRVIELTRPLRPFALVVHLEADVRDGRGSVDPPRWRSQLRRSLIDLRECGIDLGDLCVETLDYPLDMVGDLIEDLDLSVCLDVGHLMLYGFDLDEHLQRWGDRCRVVHLHGIRDGKDHRDIAGTDPALLRRLLSFLEADDVQRVLTLEVFDDNDLQRSLQTLKDLSP